MRILKKAFAGVMIHAFRSVSFEKGSVRSILVIRLNRIGDMICAIPLLKTLRHEFPDAELSVLAESGNAGIIAHEPYIDRIFVLKKDKGLVRNRFLDFKRILGGYEFDLCIGVKGGFSSSLAIMTFLSGARFRIGYVSRKGHLLDRLFNMPVSPVDFGTQHQVDSCLNLLNPIGIDNGIRDVSITIPAAFRDAAISFMSAKRLRPEKGIVIFNISSNRGTSAWSPDNFAQLGRLLTEQCKYKCIVSGLPADEKQAVEICHAIGKSAFYFRTEHIMDFAAICSLCNVLVTGDGGAGHVGAAVGVIVVTLFGAAPPAVWRPYGEQHISLKAADSDIKSIPVEEVMAILKAKRILSMSSQDNLR
jgi:ADP-heptose:LPS heptosyltransferase